MTRIIGLTGGIGCGKTRVSDRLALLGVPVIDADVIARGLTAPGGEAMAEIAATFGVDYVNAEGGLDRTRMRALVFSDAAQKRRLEAILHPRILARAQEEIRRHSAASWLVLVVPLLDAGSPWRALMNRVVVVDCDPEQQIARTMIRSGLSEDTVREILRQQPDRASRLALADEIINNCGNETALEAQTLALYHRCRENGVPHPIASADRNMSE